MLKLLGNVYSSSLRQVTISLILGFKTICSDACRLFYCPQNTEKLFQFKYRSIIFAQT